jgi:hypothetical protein
MTKSVEKEVGFAKSLLLPLMVGGAVRFLFVRHCNLEERLYFLPRITKIADADKHSLLYGAVKNLLLVLGIDPYSGLIDMNAFASFLTLIPLYIFARKRSGSEMTAYFAALGFAIHPVIVRFSCTGGHYALLLLFWFSSLALLCHENPGRLRVFNGLLLLTAAVLMRIEGVIYLLVTPLLLGRDALRGIRKSQIAMGVGFLLMAVLVVISNHIKFRIWNYNQLGLYHVLSENHGGIVGGSLEVLYNIFRHFLVSPTKINLVWPFYLGLSALPLVVGVFDRKYRWIFPLSLIPG